jgi:hypothetical protein
MGIQDGRHASQDVCRTKALQHRRSEEVQVRYQTGQHQQKRVTEKTEQSLYVPVGETPAHGQNAPNADAQPIVNQQGAEGRRKQRTVHRYFTVNL